MFDFVSSHPKQSPTPLTWIAILPINFFEDMKHIHKILSAVRFIEHLVFIILSFESKKYDTFNNVNNLKLWLLYYALCSLIIVFCFYIYIEYIKNATNVGVSTNRTLKELLKLGLFNEIQQMETFGYIYNDDEWEDVARSYPQLADEIIWYGVENNYISIALKMIAKTPEISSIRPSSTNQESVFSYMLRHHQEYNLSYNYLVNVLIKLNVDLNDFDEGGFSLLQRQCGDQEINCRANIQWLIDAGADVNASQSQLEKQAQAQAHIQAQIQAQMQDSESKLQSDISETVNTNTKNTNSDLMTIACMNGSIDLVQLLINAGARYSLTEKFPLINAEERGSEFVDMLINNNSDDINAHNPTTGETVLMIAAKYCKNDNTMIQLIQHGADINAKDEYGYTLLMLAARDKHYKPNMNTIPRLIAHGANVNANNYITGNGFTALMEATQIGNIAAFDQLIAGKDAIIDRRDQQGNTCLMIACAHDITKYSREICTIIVDKLIAANADVNGRNKNGRTPLMFAATHGNYYLMEKLILSKANINETDNKGFTPLMLACLENRYKYQVQTVEMLIKCNADIKVINKDGKNAMFYAERSEAPIATILKKANAEKDALSRVFATDGKRRRDQQKKRIRRETPL